MSGNKTPASSLAISELAGVLLRATLLMAVGAGPAPRCLARHSLPRASHSAPPWTRPRRVHGHGWSMLGGCYLGQAFQERSILGFGLSC